MIRPFKPLPHWDLDRRLNVALFLHSLSIVGFQLVLMRILSVNQWDSFANLIITVVMLGFGVSGSMLVLFQEWVFRRASWLIPLLMVVSSVCMLLAYRLSQHESVRFDTFLVFTSFRQMLRLLVFLLLNFIPFFTASLAIGSAYMVHLSGIGRLYFSNLAGAGAGGVLGLLLLAHFMPDRALLLVSVFPALGACFVVLRKDLRLFVPVYLLLAGALSWGLVCPLTPFLSQYKALSKTMLLPEANIALSENGMSSLVQVVTSPYLRYAPGLSLNFDGQIPSCPLVFSNGNAVGFLPLYGKRSEEMLDYSTFRLPYLLALHPSVAIVSGGTGMFAAQALRQGASRVDVFESDQDLLKAMEVWSAKRQEDVYSDKAVNLHRIEARAYLYGSRERFDLMVLPTLGSFGGNSGVDALKETFNLTEEALSLYWKKLTDRGLLAITVYLDYPPHAPLKTLAALVRLLREQGVKDVKAHLAAIRSWTTISYVVARKPLSTEESRTIRQFCGEMGFDPFLLPDIRPEERMQYSQMSGKELFTLADELLEGRFQELENNLFYLNPPTDDKPFFSRYVRISRLKDLQQAYSGREIPFLELGYVILWLGFVLTLLLSVLFILLPVVRMRKVRGKTPVLLYFGALGLGYMFVEIVLIQKFVLYLGQPVLAVSAVIGFMLMASGAGSYFSDRIQPLGRGHRWVLAVPGTILLVYAFFLTPSLYLTVASPLLLKVCLTGALVCLPAFFMGMPFPLGLRSLDGGSREKIAWAWSINGFLSVVATPLALILAVEAGAFWVLGFAALVYAVAFLVVGLWRANR